MIRSIVFVGLWEGVGKLAIFKSFTVLLMGLILVPDQFVTMKPKRILVSRLTLSSQFHSCNLFCINDFWLVEDIFISLLIVTLIFFFFCIYLYVIDLYVGLVCPLLVYSEFPRKYLSLGMLLTRIPKSCGRSLRIV